MKHLVYGNWWIGLCGAALAQLSYHELGGEGIQGPLMVAVLGATVVTYNLNMLSGLKELRTSGTRSLRHHWFLTNEEILMAHLGAGCVLSAAFFMLSSRTWLLLLPVALVAVLYVLPLTGGRRLREIGLWKIFLISGVWGWVTVVLPAIQLEVQPDWKSVLQLALERSLFVLTITIPFDVRDLGTDALKGVRTLPSILGWQRALVLALGVMALFTVMVSVRLGSGALGHLPAILTASALILFTRPSRPDMYYSFWLDGTMMLLAAGASIPSLF
jgi:4-hydroxybenzoate polyprenyltransferase